MTWWAFQNPEQELISLETVLEIEHIYARNRQAKEHSLANPRNIELLGNKSLLEKRINIRASDYRFCDKQKYYIGFENSRKQMKEGTKIKELIDIASSHTDFTETDIVQRNTKIIAGFIDYRVGIIANPPKHRCLCGFRGNFSIFWRQFGDNNVLRKNHN